MELLLIDFIVGATGALIVCALFFLWLQRGGKFSRAAVDEKLREAETQAKEVLLHAKEQAMALRSEAAEELRAREKALAKQEEKLSARDESLEARRSQIEVREVQVLQAQREIEQSRLDLEAKARGVDEELGRVAALTRDKARKLYLSNMEPELREAAGRRAKEIEAEAVTDAERKSRRIVLDAMQRSLVEYVSEATSAIIHLPSEDIKGRIIGREGRNIRAFEQVAGVDLIIDDTPEAVVISSFDPVRREIARTTLLALIEDGRIHPVRIEELHAKATSEMQERLLTEGETAAEKAGVAGLNPDVIEILGKLRFRTSYAQNVLDHSVEVSRMAGIIAAELGLNVEVAKRAGLLHDIGKALGPEWEGPHALAGMDFLKTQGDKEGILNAVGAHHYEIEPSIPESVVVIIADTISASRPGARRESLENYLRRLSSLEELASSFPGVERSYAIQAGREVRLIVRPEEVDDLGAAQLANAVAKKIEAELAYPGQIKVTVIRETRVQQVAR
ncbi:MAG TPA: ribonuclease Y [Fimbriimonadaceae bacterium]|nr:ribonuclease Y [Fimbriimonadaceae bacterium]